MECGKTRDDFFHDIASKNYVNLEEYSAEKLSETTGIGIQSQH